jgi:signal transduction histidine kinase
MMDNGVTTAAIGILLAGWLVAATLAIWKGMSLRNQALKSLRQTGRLTRLLETAPAIPVVVRGDNRIEASDRLSRLLGLSGNAGSLADFYGTDNTGLVEADLRVLETEVRTTQRTGKGFSIPLRVAQSDRRILVMGNIADAVIYPNGAALLWFFDLTDNLREWEKVKGEYETANAAFTALAAVIEETPLPIWHRGPDLKLNFVNKAYAAAVGATDGDAAVEAGIELVEPYEGISAAAFAADAQSKRQPIERLVSSTIDGARRQMRVIDVPLGASGVAGIAIDVQDLVDAQLEFRRLSDAQRDLLDMMSAGVAQFDSDYSLSFANLPFQRLFNVRDQWIAERPEFPRVLERIRDNGKLPEVRDFPEWRLERENWFRSANPNEENWLLPDGTHLRVLAQPMPGGGLLLIFEDRTEQAQLASARDIMLRVRTATFDNLSEAVAVFTADGKLSIWNRLFAETWALDDAGLMSHPRLDELLPTFAKLLKKPSQITVVAEILRMTTANREQRRSRVTFADGRIFQISTTPLPDGNALFTMLDMSDNVKIEQALRDRNSALSEADAIKGRFLANMSYEFRTPLTSISGFADLLKAGIAGELNAKAMEYVDAIAVSADRLSQQINTVLDYSQGEAGALPLSRTTFDVCGMLTAIAEEKAELAGSRSIDLKLEFGKTSLEIVGDIGRLTQAIGHIVDNAIRYGRPDGTALVIANGRKNDVEIIVSDNGPGMTAGDQEAIFDTMDKSQNGAVTSAETGLGLPLARQLAQAHGGTLTLTSELGQGTTVIVKLPRK